MPYLLEAALVEREVYTGSRARIAAHADFDRLWKSRLMTRKEAYAWLQQELNLPPEAAHIRLFDEVTCYRVQKAAIRKIMLLALQYTTVEDLLLRGESK